MAERIAPPAPPLDDFDDPTLTEAIAESRQPFDPAAHLRDLGNRGLYLEVRWRLVWLRREHPDAAIDTTLIEGGYSYDYATFKATVSIPGRGSASGFKQESRSDFGDFLEKAETGAIGRALAALGFGTQFCDDHTEGRPADPARGVGNMRIVDSPVDFTRRKPEDARGPAQTDRPKGVAPGNRTAPATERQVAMVRALGRECGLEEVELSDWVMEQRGVIVAAMSRADASAVIDSLQMRRNGQR